jgi:hypothetical protein
MLTGLFVKGHLFCVHDFSGNELALVGILTPTSNELLAMNRIISLDTHRRSEYGLAASPVPIPRGRGNRYPVRNKV